MNNLNQSDIEKKLALLEINNKKLEQDLKTQKRKYKKLQETYNTLKNSKLGKLQLAYWNSSSCFCRFLRFISRKIFGFLRRGKRQGSFIISEIEEQKTDVPDSANCDFGGESKKSSAKVQENPLRVFDSNDAILFMATNGAGLGHLTRSMAIARRIREIKPDQEVVFLTTSVAISLLHREGFIAYHIPPKSSLSAEMTPKQWNHMLMTMLTYLFEQYDIRKVVFDGAYPYAGLVHEIRNQNGIKKVWVKRGGEKMETVNKRLEAETYFDFIIHPQEACQNITQGDSRHIYVSPILFLNEHELLTRQEVRTLFNVPDEKVLVYVQLGAGTINDMHSILTRVINALRKNKNIVIAIGESLIGDELRLYEEDIIVIKDYPNAKYFSGFDFAISACGYNTFHELMYYGVPTLFIPTQEAGTDNQMARAELGVKAGLALSLNNFTDEALIEAITQLSDKTINDSMRKNANNLSFQNGALDAAHAILDIR